MSPDGDLIRIGEAAKLLGISPSTLHRWAVEGKIRHFEVGPAKQRRFLKEDILDLLRERKAADEQKDGS